MTHRVRRTALGGRALGPALAIAVLALLAVALGQVDDGGDTLGGGLTPPTGARFADPAWYDLIAVRWSGTVDARVLELELAAVDPERPLRQPILEAYLFAEGASGTSLLPGSGLAPPADRAWSVALRATAGGTWAWLAQPGEATPIPLEREVEGRSVRVAWPAGWPTEGAWVAISGVHDPFAPDGWRPVALSPSPWAFSATAPVPPVVDVLPGDGDALVRLQRTGRLPAAGPGGRGGPGSAWWWWMGGGLALAVAGLWWRRGETPARPTAGPDEASTPSVAGRGAAAADPSTPAAAEPAADAAAPPDAAGRPAGAADGALIDETDVLGPARDERFVDDAGAASDDGQPLEGSRRTPTGTATGSNDGTADDASSSARTTRPPSDASRSAKRS